MRPRLSAPLAGIAAATAAAALLSACGSSSSSSSSSSPSSSPSTSAAPSGSSAAPATSSGTGTGTGTLASEVPAAIRSKGTLTVAADASYAPNEFFGTDGKTVIGMDADLAKAIGQQLGLTVTVTNQTFDSIIPGLQAGRYDLGMSSFTDTKAREQVVDMVTYFSAGTSFFTKAGATPVTDLAGLCGLTVAVEKGTTQADDATAQKAKCTGGKTVTVDQFTDQAGANLALSTGRAQVSMADSPVAAYQVQQSKGAFVLSGQPYGTAPYGIAVPKGDGLAQPVLDALKALMADGTYTKILTTWGVQSGAITSPVIDGATS